MNLSLIRKVWTRLCELSTSNTIVVSILLGLFVKLPFSLLFKLLGIYDYHFILSGLFSGLLLYTKSISNDKIPEKKALCLSLSTGVFVSLFLYMLPYSGLIHVLLIPFLSLLPIFDSLPGISSLQVLNYY